MSCWIFIAKILHLQRKCFPFSLNLSINEAIDVGKKFGTEDSGAFINGILDSIRVAMEKDEIQVETNISLEEQKTQQGGYYGDEKNSFTGG